MTTDTFRGRLGEQTYTDPALFALDVKAQGTAAERRAYVLPSGRLDMGRTPAQMTVLTAPEREWLGVYVKTTDGRRGQVWAVHPMRGYLWVVIDGQAYAVHQDECSGIRGAKAEPVEGRTLPEMTP